MKDAGQKILKHKRTALFSTLKCRLLLLVCFNSGRLKKLYQILHETPYLFTNDEWVFFNRMYVLFNEVDVFLNRDNQSAYSKGNAHTQVN